MNHAGFELKGKHSPGEGADGCGGVHRLLPAFSPCSPRVLPVTPHPGLQALGNVPERLASAQLLSIARLTSGFTTELRFSPVAEGTERLPRQPDHPS